MSPPSTPPLASLTPITSAMAVSFTIINQAGLNFQRASSTISQSDLEDRLLDSRPFEAFKNEKISLDFGPWMRQMRGGEGLQVRIRAGKGRRPTRTLRQVVITIIRLIVKILKCTRGNDFPDLSLWYFTSLHQKEDRVASFNCFFTVQGRTRPLFSHEPDVASALSELSQHPLIIPARQYGESTEDDAQGETSTASLEEQLAYGLSQQRAVPFFTSTHPAQHTSQPLRLEFPHPPGASASDFIVHAVTSYCITPSGAHPVQLSSETVLLGQRPLQPGLGDEYVYFDE